MFYIIYTNTVRPVDQNDTMKHRSQTIRVEFYTNFYAKYQRIVFKFEN